jgi:hypothetical protein
MTFDAKNFRLEFYVPATHVEVVKNAVFAAGAGTIGNYDCCCWQTLGTGQFRPLSGSNPFIGRQDEIEDVEEYKVEILCAGKDLPAALAALRAAHPYETPAYQYWPVEID